MQSFLRAPIVVSALLALVATAASAQEVRRAVLVPAQPQRSAGDFIRKQDPPRVSTRLLDSLTQDNTRVQVSLSKQRAYLISTSTEEIAIDTPISSGKRGHSTPKGSYKVLQKDKDHRSSIYGDFVDRGGRVVRRGVSTKIDSAPSGTRYVGAPMRWFLRLTNDGVGMHTGILPGYPASHGCIRLPDEIAALIYSKVKLGTPVLVAD